MKRIRIIPILLLENGRLVKSIKFKNFQYLGDPINAVKIFNDKEVDEIAIIDIAASKNGRVPNITQISEIAGEAFMPLAYGGGITTVEEMKEILSAGAEKVIINSAAAKNPALIGQAAKQFGSQSVVVSIDVKKDWRGRDRVFNHCRGKITDKDPVDCALAAAINGAGEIFLNSVDRDGTYQGYDIPLVKKIADAVDIPVIACGGASNIQDFTRVVHEGNASAVAAGSMFVFQRPHQAVLISYPSQLDLRTEFFSKV